MWLIFAPPSFHKIFLSFLLNYKHTIRSQYVAKNRKQANERLYFGY